MRWISVCSLCFLAIGITMLPQAAGALTINADIANSEWQLGNFVADLIYDPARGDLSISLTNTSPLDNGGYITGFAFNNPGGLITGVSFDEPPFYLDGGPSFDNQVGFQPFGNFDIGASIRGQPAQGIGVGATDTLIFTFSGSNLNTLTENSFVSTLSEGNGAGRGYQFFAVRFQRFVDEGSDKVPGSVIPEPATLSLFGLGLVGLLGIRKKIKV